jgi:hypothetical protein
LTQFRLSSFLMGLAGLSWTAFLSCANGWPELSPQANEVSHAMVASFFAIIIIAGTSVYNLLLSLALLSPAFRVFLLKHHQRSYIERSARAALLVIMSPLSVITSASEEVLVTVLTGGGVLLFLMLWAIKSLNKASMLD